MRILIPVDGSNASLRVIEHLITHRDVYAKPDTLDIHILNVQQGLSGHVGQFVNADDIADYHREEGMNCLAAALIALDAAALKYTHHIAVGTPGEVIIQYVVELGCEEIRMGIHNRGALATFFMGSVSTEVIKLAKVPVLLVP